MAELRLTRPARAAIGRVLADSEREHGAVARVRYRALIEAALRDVAENPLRPSAKREAVGGRVLLTYALALSRNRVSEPPGRVKDPPHALVYEVLEDGVVDVYGLIHKRMLAPGALKRLWKAVARSRQPED